MTGPSAASGQTPRSTTTRADGQPSVEMDRLRRHVTCLEFGVPGWDRLRRAGDPQTDLWVRGPVAQADRPASFGRIRSDSPELVAAAFADDPDTLVLGWGHAKRCAVSEAGRIVQPAGNRSPTNRAPGCVVWRVGPGLRPNGASLFCSVVI